MNSPSDSPTQQAQTAFSLGVWQEQDWFAWCLCHQLLAGQEPQVQMIKCSVEEQHHDWTRGFSAPPALLLTSEVIHGG